MDLVTGALALSCARKAVIVGDSKQLPNVVNEDIQVTTDEIFSQSGLPEAYRYSTHSLLGSLDELFPPNSLPKTQLREHYRCHPLIINFCNRKFYNNQLIILTEAQGNRHPLAIYETVPGNHARGNLNRRQIEVIQKEIIPQKCTDVAPQNIGIVTPYRKQTDELQKIFDGSDIKADTVDKFQGREKEVIILSTVDNEITPFTDNANRLNVTVSRAVKQLIVLIHGNQDAADTNVADLIQYIRYNNLETIKSDIRSIFDYLYQAYDGERKRLLAQYGRISTRDLKAKAMD